MVIGVACKDSIRQSRLKNRDGCIQNSIDTLEIDTKKIINSTDYIIDNSCNVKDLKEEVKNFIIKANL